MEREKFSLHVAISMGGLWYYYNRYMIFLMQRVKNLKFALMKLFKRLIIGELGRKEMRFEKKHSNSSG